MVAGIGPRARCATGLAVTRPRGEVFRYGVGDDDALGRLVARQQPRRVRDHRFLREGGAWLGDDHGGDRLDPPRVGNAEDGPVGCE